MDLFRFYCPLPGKPVVKLINSEAHHLINVLRLKAGNCCELFDGAGTVANAMIKQIGQREVILDVYNVKMKPRPFNQNVIIASSIAKGRRFDWLIEKCTELGIDRIIPVIFNRTIKTAGGPKIQEHWQNVSISAAKQSGTIYLPKIDTPLLLSEALEVLHKSCPKIKILFGNVCGRPTAISEYTSSNDDVAVFIGPEGGLTEDETELLKKNGVLACRIANNVLRTETAAVAFCSILAANRFARNRNG